MECDCFFAVLVAASVAAVALVVVFDSFAVVAGVGFVVAVGVVSAAVVLDVIYFHRDYFQTDYQSFS